MGLFGNSVLNEYKRKIFDADKKLYSKLLKKYGFEPLNGKEYTDKDFCNYLKENYTIIFDETKKELVVSFGGTVQILDRKNNEIIFENPSFEIVDEEFVKLHEKCIEENIEIKYMSEHLNSADEMVYPYTHSYIGNNYEFDINKVKISISDDEIILKGPTTFKIIKDIDTTDEEDYVIQETLLEEQREFEIKFPLVFTNGNKKELSKVLKKSKIFNKNQFSIQE